MGTGDNIRQYRKAAGLTRDDLAERLQVDEKVVALWERGLKEPEEMLLCRIAEHLGVSADALRENDPPSLAPIDTPADESENNEDDNEVSLKLVTPLETSLRRGEKLIWAGKPVRRKGFNALTQPQILFKIFGLIVELFFLFSIARLSTLFVIGVIVLTAAQLVLVLRRLRRTARLREGTYYAITDERIIIRRTHMGENVRYIELGEIRSVRCDEGSGGIGSILFFNEEAAQISKLMPATPLTGNIKYTDSLDTEPSQYIFYDIAEVGKVYDIVRNLLN